MDIYIYMFIMGLLIYVIPINKRIKTVLCAIFSLVMILVAGLRADSVGTDTYSYANPISIKDTFNFSFEDKDSIEFLWVFLEYFINSNGFPSYYILLVASFITISFVFYTCKKYSSDLSFSLLIFYLLFYAVSLNGVRQILAASIALLAFSYLINNNYKRFFLFTILATGAHASSLFILVSIFLVRVKFINKTYIICLPILCYVLSLMGIDRVFEIFYSYFGSYEQYIGDSTWYINWSLMGILYNLFTIVVYIFILLSDKGNNWQLKQLYLFSVCFSLLFLNSFIFQRMALTFGIIQLLYFPYVVSSLPKSKSNLVKYVVLFFITFSYFNSLLRGFNEIIPYNIRLNFFI